MKQKKKKQVIKKRKDFRYHKTNFISKKGKRLSIRHPAYVFYEKGNVFIFILLTHSSDVKDKIVIMLKKNPNPKDKRDSYRIKGFYEDTKDNFGHRQKGWKMSNEDDIEIRDEYKKR